MKYWLLALLTGWLSATQAAIFDNNELLPVEEAFTVQAELIGNDRIRAEWQIAEGYYLYRSKFRFDTDAEGISFGEPLIPPGKKKQDEFFGEVETYRDKVAIEIPLREMPAAGGTFELRAGSQGCADIGICYPPHTQVVTLTLPASKADSGQSGGGSALQALSDLGGGFGFGNGQELLPAEEAFQLDVQVIDANTLNASWNIAEGYYLYRHAFEFTAADDSDVVVQPAQISDGEKKTDEFFGDIEVYYEDAQARIPLQRDTTGATPLSLTVKYQGCAEMGVCYPPITRVVDLVLPTADAATATTPAPPGADAPRLSEQDALAQRLMQGNLIAALLVFFGSGLLLAFTPCVFPMIPILSSIIVGQGKELSTARSFTLSLVYVLAMAVTYTVAGVLAGLFGENLQAYFQDPWILSTFALIFVLLALSMFGFYDLQMPSFIQNRLTAASNRQQSGSLTGVAVMGFLSALIVGPCVAAPLMGALIVIGQTGDAVLGGMALFALSLGMGAPLLAIGTGAGKLLPRAGKWMDAIKAVFGVLLLAVAIWMLERILPAAVSLALWAALLILSAIYLRALDQLPVEATGWSRLWKGLGVMALVYGVVLLIGAASGARDPLQPLAGMFGGAAATQTETHALPFRAIKTVSDLERELAAARQQGKPVMVDFYADWCVSCKEMEKYTFAKPGVQQALSDFVLLQADVTANDEADKALLQHYQLFGPPTMLFYDEAGRLRPDLTLVGFKPADEFVEHVQELQ
ncbi:MAG: protein-disulfide reductase DsbD [Thiogranum sp.]|nr:protein-disulfide reductase DsbD [Thiogranum sp.]